MPVGVSCICHRHSRASEPCGPRYHDVRHVYAYRVVVGTEHRRRRTHSESRWCRGITAARDGRSEPSSSGCAAWVQHDAAPAQRSRRRTLSQGCKGQVESDSGPSVNLRTPVIFPITLGRCAGEACPRLGPGARGSLRALYRSLCHVARGLFRAALGNDPSRRAESESALPPHGSRPLGLDPEPVVHGMPQLLLAAQVALGRLDGHVPEKELDLVEFAAGQVA